MLHPQPRFKLSFLEHLLCVYYSLFEHSQVLVLPYAPYNSWPYTFPNHVLFIVGLGQEKTLKVVLQVIVLDNQDTNPPIT